MIQLNGYQSRLFSQVHKSNSKVYMKHTTHQLVDRLGNAKLFSNVGLPMTNEVTAVHSWEESIRWLSLHDYKVLLNEANNAISVAVARVDRELFNTTWNDNVDSIKGAIELPIVQKVAKSSLRRTIPKEVLIALRWDVLMACMESEYATQIRASRKLNYVDCLRPGFYTKLMKWYLAGHFPCGWTGGEYPIGTLVVY